ncbi:unnamed protein product [Zymoseptoria tritici ST99CH_1A5]|uniref:Uncharacterized protein n=1 Tax=Zymoseptoria tritici ST99CH_1A5 TaxID=1276529 RepID=A0A1Y6LBS7_ZYMTR|nr:unnamed protein product [Zymoseptoria tritici ST99CH_1A5]
MATSLSLTTARYLAPASFLYDFAAQQYGINSTPSMKDIHDRNLSFFSPQPYFIAGFFFPQQFVQLAWLYKLWKLNPEKPEEKKQLQEMVRYVPFYALGNVCIGTWMFFWNAENLKVANAFVVVNTTAQLFYVFTKLSPMNTRSTPSVLTHIVAKTFAGIGVLDILHNTSVGWFKDQLPSTAVKIGTALGFAGLAAGSDWILGGCLVYCLVGLSVGQASYNSSWSKLLGVYAVGTAAIVGVRNWVRPPYVKEEYEPLAEEDEETV